MLTAILAPVANGSGARSNALYLAGLDVLLEGGSGIGRHGVPIDSIHVDEQGPGGVSAMTFTVEDPNLDVTLAAGQDVRYEDLTNGRPRFYGWVQSWTTRPWGLGRQIDVICIGIEALLDWMMVSSVTITHNQVMNRVLSETIANASTPGFPLRTAYKALGETNDADGDLTAPIGTIVPAPGSGPFIANTVSNFTIEGVTLREALRQEIDLATDGSDVPVYGQFTIDFYGNLRIWRAGLFQPGDYATLTVTDTTAGSIRAEAPEYTNDATGVVRGVYVKGGNAAGSGLRPDGSGLPGQIARIDAPTITTSADRDLAAAAYLAAHAASLRGSLRLSDTGLATNVRAGSLLILTDAQLGQSSSVAFIGQLGRDFHPGGEDWTVTFGGLAPSLARLLRRLTRGTLS